MLLDYNKSNKERRVKAIAKAGFSTEAEYLAFLMEADVIAGSPAAAALFKHNKKEEEETDALDQVIAFDTTGSMASYIHDVRAHIKELVGNLFSDNPNLRIKIVAFGDYCDMIGPDNFGIAYQETALTNNQNDLVKFVTEAKNTGGGDADEFYELVIKRIVEETPWRINAKKAVLFIGDCGPHPVGYTYPRIITKAQIDWRKEAEKAAALNIQFDTLNCGVGYQEIFYRPLSEITNGVNIPFKTSSKTKDAIFAATSVRGSTTSKASYTTSMDMVLASGDDELIGTYKSLSKKL